jgi:hypothetical protein
MIGWPSEANIAGAAKPAALAALQDIAAELEARLSAKKCAT